MYKELLEDDIFKAIDCLKENKPTLDPRECSKELCDACDVATQAMYKQIPNKPVFMKEFNNSVIMPHCSACLHLLEGAINYCPRCGQKIDWGLDS